EPPVVGLLLDHLVDLGQVLARSVEDLGGELARVRLRLLQLFEGGHDRLRRVAGQIVLIQHLQRELTRFAAGTHGASVGPFFVTGAWWKAERLSGYGTGSPSRSPPAPPPTPCSPLPERSVARPAPGCCR